MIVLINQYKNARKELRNMLATLGNSDRDVEDKKLINSMINDTTYIIEWIEKGGNPEEMRGINIRQAYHIKYLSNMDILPDLTNQITEERDPLVLTDEKKRLIIKFFESLSDRERDCFILHVTQDMSMSEVADELGINKASVQTYINRAKEKAEMIKRLY